MKKSKKAQEMAPAPGQFDLLTGQTLEDERPGALEMLAAADEVALDCPALNLGEKYPPPTVAAGGSLRIWEQQEQPAPVEKAPAKKTDKKAAPAPEKPKIKKQQEKEEREKKKAELQEKIEKSMAEITKALRPLRIEIFRARNWLWFGDVPGDLSDNFESIMMDYGGAHWACGKRCYCWHHPEDTRGVHGGAEVDLVDIVNTYGFKQIA